MRWQRERGKERMLTGAEKWTFECLRKQVQMNDTLMYTIIMILGRRRKRWSAFDSISVAVFIIITIVISRVRGVDEKRLRLKTKILLWWAHVYTCVCVCYILSLSLYTKKMMGPTIYVTTIRSNNLAARARVYFSVYSWVMATTAAVAVPQPFKVFKFTAKQFPSGFLVDSICLCCFCCCKPFSHTRN